ncbi:hypothetical protein KP509_02G103600 [Ceratopteris richardii]|nr:hypothetical protein KP509_02G103600 [Ceratopteris richardii]KAH7445043.1 hypothetical protein KP509_02G103600 [Ceratopteris richardii]
MSTVKEQVKKERDFKDEKEQRQAGKEENDSEEEGNADLGAQQRSPNKRISERRADELIQQQSEGVEAGDMARMSVALSLSDGRKVLKGLQRNLGFFENVKSKTQSQETYQEFLKCLNLYSEEIITLEQLHSLVDELLGKFPDLVESFNDFLARCKNIEPGDGRLLELKVEKEIKRERERKRCIEEERAEQARDSEKEREREGRVSSREISNHKDSSGGNKGKYIAKKISNHKVSSGGNRAKYVAKAIFELDLSNCEQCTPSYRLLPKSYPKPIVSQRNLLAQEVLNDTWVSVTSESEDHSFQPMRRNQYEETLFRCEDDRFELDMLLESTAITAKRMEDLLKKLHKINVRHDGKVHLDDYLSAINIRCIERIYGDHSLDVVRLLRKNAIFAVPVILTRLKQKCDEWTKCKKDMNKVWAEVYAKNFHKSLDYQSFYIKEQDKKTLSIKALLAEIKKINERKHKDDGIVISIAAGNRGLSIPDLRFEYPEPDVNEDLYQITKHSADEMCSSMKQLDKIMHLRTEPIFGLLSQLHAAEDTDKMSKGKSAKSQSTGSRKNDTDRKEEKVFASEMEFEKAGLNEKLDASQAERSKTSAAACRMLEG